MTNVVLPFDSLEVPPGTGGLQRDVHVSRERPMWLNFLRIYELSPALADPVAIDVIADALQLKDRDSVDEIIREYGIVGHWRPSTIIVDHVTEYGANRRLVSDSVVAHALWNVDLHCVLQRSSLVRLQVSNDQAHGEARLLRAVLVCTELTDEELRPEGQDTNLEQRFRQQERRRKVRGLLCFGCNTALGSFRDSIIRLEAAIGYLRRTTMVVG